MQHTIIRRKSSSSTRCKWMLLYLLGAVVIKFSCTFLYDYWIYANYNYNNLVASTTTTLTSSSSVTPPETGVKIANSETDVSTIAPTNPIPEPQPLEQPSSTTTSPPQPAGESSSSMGSTPSSTSSLSPLTPPSSSSSISDALLSSGIDAEDVWSDLIEEASRLRSKGQDQGGEGVDPGIFVEVGMYRAVQCLNAAIAGHEAHCVEPSQVNFDRVQSRVHQAKKEVQDRMHLYNVAAGSVTGRVLEFHSGGGTGDRVGHVDVWNMEQNPNEEPTAMTKVEEMRMDDIIMKQPNGAFLIKVDTQGFEPHVFAGLEETLQTQKAKFILLEYWPKGMDLMTSTMGNCTAVTVLEKLSRAGYHLYQLPVTAHPKAPKEWRVAYRERTINIPLDDYAKNCQWYYDLEKQFPSPDYKMGYWSDILAVAPLVQLEHPITKVGKLLFPNVKPTKL